MLSVISHEENATQNHMRYLFIFTRIAKIKTKQNQKINIDDVEKLEPPYIFGRIIK